MLKSPTINYFIALFIKLEAKLFNTLPGLPSLHVLMKVVLGGTASPSPIVTSFTNASSGCFTLG